MADLQDVTRLPGDFSGRVRLFPLPELVLFPHAMQPLHIFEPRYCEMLLEALASDRLITMATLMSGVVDVSQTKPAISPIVCICKVISHAETENGQHNVLLVGAQRARVIREIATDQSFRVAEVEVLQDVHAVSDPQQRKLLRAALLDAFAGVIPRTANVQQNLHELMAGQMGLGPITDIISYTLGLSYDAKLQLLAEVDIERRAKLLIGMLKQRAAESDNDGLGGSNQGSMPLDFPPPFSLN